MSKFYKFILIILLFSCNGKIKTVETEISLSKFGIPNRIEYYKPLKEELNNYEKLPLFVITDNVEIKNALSEIQNASEPKPWKGAGWSKIDLIYSDTIISIFTNKERIGFYKSGVFYKLNRNNFITKRLIDK